MPELHQRAVHVYLTAAQLRYLGETATDPDDDLDGTPDALRDTVITMVDDRGGIFVEQASTAGDEGSGVWVDAAGTEHHGPGGTFAESKGAAELAARS